MTWDDLPVAAHEIPAMAFGYITAGMRPDTPRGLELRTAALDRMRANYATPEEALQELRDRQRLSPNFGSASARFAAAIAARDRPQNRHLRPNPAALGVLELEADEASEVTRVRASRAALDWWRALTADERGRIVLGAFRTR